ncbi:cystathionine beta-lyase [Streptococcus himalayensis]|uniref:Cystathionine beta-lyase n=1 Tax=Streptococcus himalayensis TaxID=1888195 RepID=A0A917EEL3_9STRE|nr:cystathionine beta-lyase [Streptococcus himalayensis]GGE32371.1 cystathionine beta-lyase [Streptococcus himalayensis]
MTDYIQLALDYGGFTSLDRVYLANRLKELKEEEKLRFVTPPPSVLNAYFAELYQKKSPLEATYYFLDVSKAFQLWNEEPSFNEEKPFIRLNLSGKSYGFCYETEELARVFPEKKEAISPELCFEIAQIFPDFLVYEENGKIYLELAPQEEIIRERQELTALTNLELLADGHTKLVGYNQEELVTLAANYEGNCYYRSQNRLAMLYIK